MYLNKKCFATLSLVEIRMEVSARKEAGKKTRQNKITRKKIKSINSTQQESILNGACVCVELGKSNALTRKHTQHSHSHSHCAAHRITIEITLIILKTIYII